MEKNSVLEKLDYISYFCLINAIVFFIIFEYSGAKLMQNISLILFVLFSVTLIAFEITKIISKAKENEKISAKLIVVSMLKIIFACLVLAFCTIIYFNIKIF